jgi:PBP1b-binding outer membrane lipoprotein LpoB
MKIVGRSNHVVAIGWRLIHVAALGALLSGCASPELTSTRTKFLAPDEEDNIGGSFLESGDIRTIATRMSGELLSTPQIANGQAPVRIALAPIRNSTRFLVDKDIFMKRLRIELSQVAGDRVRFYSQDVGQETRSQILREQNDELWDVVVSEVADYLLHSPALASATTAPTVAVIPVRNTNIAGLNADSFTALLRAKIAERADGKVIFLSREKNGKVIDEVLNEKDVKSMGLAKVKQIKELYGVDYFLGGEFIAQSLTMEGAPSVSEGKVGVSKDDPRVLEGKVESSVKKPNVTKYLNVSLIDAETGAVAAEKLVTLEREMKSGLGSASYLLTGELSALSKAAGGGARSDYIILSFQLVDPKTNEVLWESAYETKRKTKVGTVYQ